MIRPLRRRHLRWILAVTLLTGTLLVLALRARPEPPRLEELPAIDGAEIR